ncbi:DNA topoisomerase IB [Cupriavidus sp. AU9028]|uniref:DNA topoisomerase IB n=1 Tax=Cupriavidus sp. AU9028 TaxID=2871157 RepID=UPI001C957A48|nr:DNA topoisomerase IB [Cupriavidus sp. AU9028]MBY4899049.1 DNA topoisomerase IB [Cupriavidus sp. AU9028]
MRASSLDGTATGTARSRTGTRAPRADADGPSAARAARPQEGRFADTVPEVPPGLRYVNDTGPGITRKLSRGKFQYFTPDGKPIKDQETIARIHALAIPPAYEDVWICPDPRGHLQATGRDARGRKQYRYHPAWIALRDENKYDRLLTFGRALPRLRRRARRDLQRSGMPREKVLGAVLLLLDQTLVRVGSRRYARQNRTYGLTTLRRRHVQVRGSRLRFMFTGKSGVEHDVTLRDRQLARIVRDCADLPGQHLFKYRDEDGEIREVGSVDVNAYIQEVTGGDFTAKDFRTWAGSVHALAELRKLPEAGSDTARKRAIASTIKIVARRLRNTVAVCRKCYVHPAVVDAYMEDRMAACEACRRAAATLSIHETRLLTLLEAEKAADPA